MFRTLPVAAAACRVEALPESAHEYLRHTVTLGWEDRLKTRGRRRTDGGVEFGVSLPRGTVLRGGDCLVLESIRTLVEVVEREEEVFIITPRTSEEAALYAYWIGNGHQSLMIDDGRLVCPDVPGAQMLLDYHGIPYRRANAAFTPTTTPGHPVMS